MNRLVVATALAVVAAVAFLLSRLVQLVTDHLAAILITVGTVSAVSAVLAAWRSRWRYWNLGTITPVQPRTRKTRTRTR